METIRPIETEQDYELALKEMTSVFQAAKNTPEGDKLELWALLCGCAPLAEISKATSVPVKQKNCLIVHGAVFL